MSNKVAVVTDSTAYLPEHLLKQYNISVTPLSVIWGDEAYRDGVDILPIETMACPLSPVPVRWP